MDPRQTKCHVLLQTILGEACVELSADATIKDQVGAGEFETAIASLIQSGDSHGASPTFWWNLKKAAEVLDLKDLYAPLRQRRLSAQRAS